MALMINEAKKHETRLNAWITDLNRDIKSNVPPNQSPLGLYIINGAVRP